MNSACAVARKPQAEGAEETVRASCDCIDQPGVEVGVPRFLQAAGLQARLEVGAVDDPLEQEADEFALAVQHELPVLPRFMARDEAAVAQPVCDECAEEMVDQLADEGPPVPIRRERLRADPPDDDGDGDGSAGAGAPDDLGTPLLAPLRSRLEPNLGMDLGEVRVHSGPLAARAASSLRAKAFTHAGDIWLGAGQRADDIGLIAHEVAHVVQQGGAEEAPIRRAPADYRHPEDGGNVGSRMQSRISEATRDRDADELPSDPAARAHEARSAASQIDRGELAAERAEVEPAARPDVDRPAAEAPKVEQAKSETRAEADSPAQALAEGSGAEGEVAAGKEGGEEGGEAGSAADAAAALAEQAFGEAAGQAMPGPEAVVVPPAPVAPVDAGGAPLPGDAEADGRIAALAGQAQSLRGEGTRVRSLAVEERGNAALLAGNVALVRGGVSMAEQGVGTSREHLATRQELAGQARGALAVAEQKAATVAAEAPNFASKADEGKAESGPMASEAGQLSAENAANTPDDPEAAAEAREQGGKMNQAGADIGTTDEAVTRTREKAGSLGDDAARAEQTNTETGARLDGNDEQLSASGEKLGEMAAQNAAARASVEALAAAPDAQRQQAGQLEGQGAGLVTASFDIEGRLAAVQRDYAQAMQAVPAEELPEAEDEQADAAEPGGAAGEAALAPEFDGLVQRSPDDGAAAVAAETVVEAPPPAAAPPLADAAGAAPAGAEAALDSEPLLPEGPPEAAAGEAPPASGEAAAAPPPPPEGERERVDAAGAVAGALPEWLTGAAAPNAAQREEAVLAAEERRQSEIDEIEAMAGGEFANLSAADKMGIALRMTGRNLFGSVSGIQWPGWGHLALGLIDPRGPLMGVVSGLGMMLSGGANLFSAAQWQRDPLGNLLKSAADIATGLTVILGSITALAGVIIAIMTAITILSFGTAAPVTGPVIAFCTTVLTTVGGWTIAVGQVALVLQALVFIKNLIDAACAETASELQSETQQLTENVGDAANVVMQMGMAKAGQLGGRAAASEISAAGGGVRYAAGMGARAGVGARAGLGAAGRGLRAAPGAALRGVRALPGAVVRGARALPGAAMRGARALPGLAVRGARGVASGVTTVGRGTLGLARRGVAGVRALPGRALAGVRALPGRIAAAPGGIVRGVRGLPARLRESVGEGLSRSFLVGDDIANAGMARSAAAETRAAVWAEARAPGGALAAEARVAAAADEAVPASPAEMRGRVDELEPSPAASREASVRESGSMESAELSPRQVADELAYVDEHPGLVRGEPPNRRAAVGEHEIVERPAPEMPGGVACARHSNGGLPVPCPSSLGAGPGAPGLSLNRLQRAQVRRLGEELHAHGLGWEDLGLADEAAVARHFGEYASADDAIAALQARARRSIDIRGAHAEAQQTGTARANERALAPESAEGAAIGVERRVDVPEGQRMPRPTDVPDASYGGNWGGERGNSEWFSDVQAVNDVTGYRPIEFVGGEPVFLPWAEERAILNNMTGIDHVDFAAADRALLRQHPGRWPNQTAVAEWRSSQRLTWHHEPDLESMTLVPMDLHGNVPHIGGASPARGGARPGSAAPFETSPL